MTAIRYLSMSFRCGSFLSGRIAPSTNGDIETCFFIIGGYSRMSKAMITLSSVKCSACGL